MLMVARHFRIGACSVLALACTLAAHAGAPEDRVAAAKSLIAMETKGDFAGVAARVDPNSKRFLSQDTLKARWTGIVKRGGPLKSVGTGHQQKVNQYDLVTTPCQFAKGDVEAKITFNADGKITSFFFVPAPGSKLPPERSAPSGPPRGFGGPGGPGGPPRN